MIETTKNDAQLYQVNLIPQLSSFEFSTFVPEVSPFHISVLPNGEIYQIQLTKVQNIEESTREHNLLSYEEIQELSNQIRLVSITGEQATYVSNLAPASIKSIEISEIKLVYLIIL